MLFDIEQIREIGFCNGVENYSRVLAGREPAASRIRCWTISRRIF